MLARRTRRFQRTGSTRFGISLVDHHPLGGLDLSLGQGRAVRTARLILVQVIGKVLLAIERRPLVEVGQGYIGAQPGLLNGHDVLGGAIFGIARHLGKWELPANAAMPEQVAHWLVVHHLGRRDQRRKDNPPLSAIDRVVRVVAQVSPAPFLPHERRIGVGPAGPDIRHPLVVPALDFPIWSTTFGDPVVAYGMLGC